MTERRVARLEATMRLNSHRLRQRTYTIERDENTSDDEAIRASGVTPQDDDTIILLVRFGASIAPRLLRVD